MIQTLKMSDAEVRLALERYLSTAVFSGEYAKTLCVEKLEQLKSGGYSDPGGFEVTIGQRAEQSSPPDENPGTRTV